MEPTFFATPAELRAWFKANHQSETELLVGFYKVDSGRPSITWPESVDEALCVGWIDGVRRSLGASSYTIRFTPRKPRSIWSAKNLARVEELIAGKRMLPAGLAAYEQRTEDRSRQYSFEQGDLALGPEFLRAFKKEKKAWEFYSAQAASYRKASTWWVMSAKREETRESRLKTLIADSAAGLWISMMRRAQPKGAVLKKRAAAAKAGVGTKSRAARRD